MIRGVGARLPHYVVTPVVEWRAQRIADPVAKLRFLRHAMGTEWDHSEPLSARWKPASVALAACLSGCLLLPLPTSSDTIEPLLRDRFETISSRSHGEQKPEKVWPVEQNDEYEVYSNGLRIENQYATPNQMRFYQAYDPAKNNAADPQWRTQPAGIVFHTTESHITPFAEDYANKMKRIGAELIGLIRQNRSYHYVIDRFGRVFRVVVETDAANHAGNSVWADGKWTYLNLNNSFLGIAFEAQTGEGESTSVTPAQIHAGRILTQMLRSRYNIPAANCVTHAQVSVNPSNMLIGYHTDWAANFPFQEFELEDNYAQPMPAISVFGFEYNTSFVKQTGPRMMRGLAAGEQALRRAASAKNLAAPQYRNQLQQRYKELLAALKDSAPKEKTSGSE